MNKTGMEYLYAFGVIAFLLMFRINSQDQQRLAYSHQRFAQAALRP